jgi:hypothetical protein
MTWRVCSPPWPARRNRVSWPGRRQCGLPSAGRPPRSASPPLPGGQCGVGDPGIGDEIVPAPGWPRRWSRWRLGWAASWRPIRTCCPAPFSNWPTWPSRRRLRPAPARPGPPPWGRDSPRRARNRPPASRVPGRAVRRAWLRPPARRPLRNRASRRRPRGHPITTGPVRVADPAGGPRRARRPSHRLIPARRPGRRSLAGSSPRDPRSSPRCTSLNPDRCVYQGGACPLCIYTAVQAVFPARQQSPTMKTKSSIHSRDHLAATPGHRRDAA